MKQKIIPLVGKWVRFNAIGTMGVGVQMLVIVLLRQVFDLNYFIAMFFALQCAIIHNFFWHQRWTWSGNLAAGKRASIRRFLRYSSSTGTISIFGTLGFTALLLQALNLPYIMCHLMAIGACNIANFLLSHNFVFQPAETV